MSFPGNQKPEMIWGMFCDHFLVDASGKYSFIGIFERIGAASFPAVHKVLYLVCSVRGPAGTRGTAVVNIWTPDVALLLSTQESPVQFDAEGRAMLVHLLYDLNFARSGQYNFALEVNGRPAGERKLELYEVQLPPPGAPR